MYAHKVVHRGACMMEDLVIAKKTQKVILGTLD